MLEIHERLVNDSLYSPLEDKRLRVADQNRIQFRKISSNFVIPRKCTEGFALIAETVGHESAERTAISIGLDAPLASAMCLAYFRYARPILCLRGASRPSLSSSRPFPTRRLCPLYPPFSSSSRWRDLVRSTNSDNELPGNRPRNSNGPPDFSRTRQRTGWRHLEPRRE